MATLTSSTYWDDQTALSNLVTAISGYGSNIKNKATKGANFYKNITRDGNHRNVDDYNAIENRKVLAAYDGDKIEGSEKRDESKSVQNVNQHAYMTNKDLLGTRVGYARSSFLSAGLTESVWADSVNGKISAIGFTGENGENYFTNNQTQYDPGGD